MHVARHRQAAFSTAFLLTTALASIPALSMATSRPNIVIVVGDDVGWGDVRANNPDGKIALPAIEKLARGGIRFSDAHTFASKCAPSRYSILTGNYQWRGRLSWGTWQYKGGSQLLPGQATLGSLLKRAGYSTAIVGKYHLGAHFYKTGSAGFATASDPDTVVDFSRAMVDGPSTLGFDYSFVAMRGIQAGPYAFFENGSLYGRASDLKMWNVGDYGNTQIIEGGIGLPNWVTRDVGPTLLSKALQFIESHHSAQAETSDPKPFFLYLASEAVHGPRKPPVAIGSRAISGISGLGKRTDMLVELDVVLDNVILRLEQLGLLENTLIVFTSDNGGSSLYSEINAGHLTSGGFRGDKGTIYEGGHRVPLIMKWGNGAFESSPHPAGTVIDALVAVPDLYATLAALVGVPIGLDEGRDSISFLPVLQGQAAATRDHIVSEADEPEDEAVDGGISGRHFAYRGGSWKLVFNGSRTPVGLYDLSRDPHEANNLLAQPEQSQRVATLRASFDQVLISTRTAPTSAPGTTSYTLAPSSLAFGSQLVSTSSGERTIALTNTGSIALTLASVSLAGANRDQFAQTNDCGASLPVGTACGVRIRFNPTSVGAKAAELVVSVDGGTSTGRATLSGTGTAASTSATVSPTSIAFGNVASGTVSAARSITISNTGSVRLPITSVALKGTNYAQFAVVSSCPAEVAVGGKCTVQVSFKPKSKGSKTATLSISFGGGASSRSVPLTGVGV